MKEEGNRKIFQHFVLTCFNVVFEEREWCKQDKSWLRHRFKLFNKFCYPSIRGQSNKNFKWIVLFNINTPDVFKQKIKKYSEWENFIPVYIGRCRNINDPDMFVRKEIIPQYLDSGSKYLITTRVDSDDGICKDYVQMIQNHFDKQKLQFINFNNGYVWNYNTCEVYLDEQPSNPFISLIEEVGEIKTVWCENHPELCKVGPVKGITTKPAWLQVVHGRNISNQISGILQSPGKIKYIDNNFEIKVNHSLVYWKAFFYYRIKRILDSTRSLRHYMGLTAEQLTTRIKKLLKVVNINR